MTSSSTSNAQLLISKSSLLKNIDTYKSLIGNTKLMIMVKANGYGTDLVLLSKIIEKHIDYLAIAYSSAGYLLRDSGISAPIMVMASKPSDLKKIATYNLEPVLYSIAMIKAAIAINKPLNIHIEIDTGMKRLGLSREELPQVLLLINKSQLQVLSIFSHLVDSSTASQDTFSHSQASCFKECFTILNNGLKSTPFKHLLNSGGVQKFPQYHFDMVRVGIGFYGFDKNYLLSKKIKAIATLQTSILQIIKVKKGETIGYSRKGTLPHNGRIATLSIGYADGYLRILGNGNASVFINGRRAKIIGNICMDLIMVDITNIECELGDKVEMFGPHITVQELAISANTIPNEILTNINSRVERILVE